VFARAAASAAGNLILGAEISEIPKIVAERVTILTLQRVVIDNILQVADESIQLALIEFSLAQVPIEIRSAVLRVSIPLDLFLVSLDLLDVSVASEISGPFEVALHTPDQVPGSAALGRAKPSR
jgi:hypothetical protein